LGATLDIHGGGLDLQFPHHENELAQSESFNDQPFARYWLHNGLMRVRKQAGKIGGRSAGASESDESEKMSKSLGNVINIVDLLKSHHPETLRFLLLSTHYRSPIEYSEERLVELRKALDGFYRLFERYQRITGEDFYRLQAPTTFAPFDASGANADFLKEISRLRDSFLSSMDDDFNTGGAVGALFETLAVLNRFADAQKLEEPASNAAAKADFRKAVIVLRELSNILGLFWEPQKQGSLGGGDELVAGLMNLLIEIRNNLRNEAKKIAAKDDPARKAMFDQTDVIRKRLAELGVTLEDRPGGTGWRIGG
jgi:cysteinyl-tRNA synthetase